MSRSRAKHKGRSETGGFFALPHAVTASPSFIHLSAPGVKLLVDVGAQYRGSNNGDLCATWSVMAKRGWKSRDTLDKALAELLAAGLIQKTRQGGRNRCSLYALTWLAIDACGGKLDVPATRVASGLWRAQPIVERVFERRSGDTPSVSSWHGGRVNGPSTSHALTRRAG